MALGKSTAIANREVIFVDLKFAPNKGEDYVGFRQVISKTPRENVKEGERKYDYTYETHNFVSGEIVNFRVKEEPRYDNPNEKDFVAYVSFRDEGEPDVVVRFPLHQQAGRRLVGLIAAALERSAGSVYLYTNYAPAGSKIGDKVLEKPQAYINMKLGDQKGEKLTPLYYDDKGKPMLDEKGKPLPLPMGVKHVIGRKEIWDFEQANNVVSATAIVLMDHFRDAHNEHEVSGESFAQEQEDDVDLHEAATAAMR